MKKILLLLVMISILTPLAAGQHRSVPIGHRAYEVIESAELRGIITPQISIKPYAASKVVALLEHIKNSDRLTANELIELVYLIGELKYQFITEDAVHMIRQGSYRTYDEDLNMGVSLGAAFDGHVSYNIADSSYDIRQSQRAILRGDITDFASFYMDFGIRLDRLDNRPFMDTDFSIQGEGFYLLMAMTGSRLNDIPKEEFAIGFDFYPELSLSLLSGNLQMRFGNIKRDWGVGLNGLQVAGTARPFDGIEGHINLSSWMRYSFITGSLGIFSLNTLGGEPFFSDYLGDRENYKFATNFSAKRVEVDFPLNITFGIFESNVWQKRFEMGYLNPFSILMFHQNLLGDLDNMLAGVDLQWRLPGILRVHGTWATTEMNEISISRFLKAPRNIMGMQAGIDIHLPVGNFSLLSFQYTHLHPFFYTHYLHTDEMLYPGFRHDESAISTAYVNKGENLGYPLHPNSDEFLARGIVGISERLSTTLTFRYQRRSGQYGYKISDEFDYDSSKYDNYYEDKAFKENIFEQTLSLEMEISKQFKSLPITLFGGYHYFVVWDRGSGEKKEPLNPEDLNKVWGNWRGPFHNHVFRIGVNIFK